jgi:transforming growth factor-beta-induced protein
MKRFTIMLALVLGLSATAVPAAFAKQDIGTSDANLVETALAANADGDFDLLIGALTAVDGSAGFLGLLSGPGSFAVYAPTDQAFIDLASAIAGEPVAEEDVLGTLVDALGVEAIIDVLAYHVAGLDADYDKLLRGRTTMANGDVLKITRTQLKDGTGAKAKIIAGPVFASNGYINVIDKVVLPG